MTTRSQHGANHNRKHCLKRDGSNKSTRFVVLGRPEAQSSTLDTDGFDHILFKKHQTALKKALNAALKDTQQPNASTACDYLGLYMDFQVLKLVLSL